jgi:hypothetical protein
MDFSRESELSGNDNSLSPGSCNIKLFTGVIYYACNKLGCLSRHHDAQHNDIQHNDIQHNDIQHNDIQHNDIQKNDI